MMLTNFFAKSKPITFIVLLGLFFGYFFLTIFKGFSIDFYTENTIFSYFRYVLLLLLTFFFQNFIVTKNNLTFDNSYAFLFFMTCLGLLPFSFLNEKTLFINLILILFLRKVYSLQSPKNVFKKIFDAGFWLGVGFLVEPFIAIFGVLLYIAIYTHQKIIFQTLGIPIIGFIVPLFLYFTYCFWLDTVSDFYALFNWFTSYDLSIYKSVKFIFPFILIGVFLVFSILVKTPKALAVKNIFRKSWVLMLLHFLIATIFIVLLKNSSGSELLYLLLPTSLILANGLELLKKTWIKDLVISTFLIGSFVIYFL